MFELLVLILVFMILAGVLAIEADDLVSAVVSMGAVGFGLSACFLLLRAPDVALVQIVVEVVILILLLRGTIGMGIETVKGHRDRAGMAGGVILVVLFLALALYVAVELPKLGEPGFVRFLDSPSWTYLKESLSLTGATNAVNAVLLDFRGYDTLGEVIVLFTAVLGSIALLRRKHRQEKKDE